MIGNYDNLTGGLYGLLIGDALGVPYEFHAAEEIPPYEEIEMTPPSGFQRAHVGVDAGTWSDDGAQALCLLDSIVTCGKFQLKDFSDRILAWYQEGKWAVSCVLMAKEMVPLCVYFLLLSGITEQIKSLF